MPSGSTVAITGASGFLGHALMRAFVGSGWRVIALTRRPVPEPQAQWHRYDLFDASLSLDTLHGADVLLHCAYVRGRSGIDAFAVNVAAARLLFDSARRCGTKHVIFISSLAAGESALSEYGRQKFAIEQLLDLNRDTVVRPGLVLGRGGLFETICNYLRRRPFVPLIDGGRQPVQSVYVDDLSRCILTISEQRLCGRFTIADYPGTPYREFYRLVATSMGVPIRFISLPFWVLDTGLRAAELLRVGLPIDRDNLLGVRTAEVRATTPFSTFGVQPRTTAEAIRCLTATP